MRYHSHPSKQSGSTLLEGLISIFIFSIGVISVMALQLVSLRETTDSQLRAEASYLSEKLVGQMWSDTVNLDKYDTQQGTYTERDDWVDQVEAALPAGQATVTVNGSDVSIQLSWQAAGTTPHTFSQQTTITR
ncbi:type IV pilus modification PilV family protein [Chitinibacteraceae bacterium HSL-7]